MSFFLFVVALFYFDVQIYWSDIGIGAISMAYLNGSQQEVVFAHSQIGTSFMACVIVRITLNMMTKKVGLYEVYSVYSI